MRAPLALDIADCSRTSRAASGRLGKHRRNLTSTSWFWWWACLWLLPTSAAMTTRGSGSAANSDSPLTSEAGPRHQSMQSPRSRQLSHAGQAASGITVSSILELRNALAASNYTVDAYLLPGTYRIGSPLVLHQKELRLRSDGATIDAERTCRHFLVQHGSTLELEGVTLLNGVGKVAGGAILARRGATLRLHDAAIDGCSAMNVSGGRESGFQHFQNEAIDNGRSRGGGIALVADNDGAPVELALGQIDGDGMMRSAGLAFSPDGRFIVSSDGSLKVWESSDIGAGPLAVSTLHSGTVLSAAFSPDGLRIVSGSSDGTLTVWNATDVGEGPLATVVSAHSSGVNSVAFSPGGTRILSGSSEIKLWDSADFRAGVSAISALDTGSGHSGMLWSMEFSSNGNRIVTAGRESGGEGTIRVWDAASLGAGALATGTSHGDEVYAAVWSPDDLRIVSASKDKTLKLWDSSNVSAGALASGTTDGVGDSGIFWSVAYLADGLRIVSGSGDNEIKVWNATDVSAGPLVVGRGHNSAVKSVVVAPDGSGRIVSGCGGWLMHSDGHALIVWDVADVSAGLIATGTGHEYAVKAVAYSPDGMHIVSGAEFGKLHVWYAADVGAGPIATGSDHTMAVTSVAYSPDGLRIASSSDDGTIRLWAADDVGAGPVATGFVGGNPHYAEVFSMAYSPDGLHIVSGHAAYVSSHAGYASGHAGYVRLWNATNMSAGPISEGIGPGGNVYAVAFSPDGSRIASGGSRHCGSQNNCTTQIALWNSASLSTGPLVLGVGHDEDVTSVAFSPDGTRIVTGSYDSTIKIWDTANLGAGALATGRGHNNWVSSVTFSTDGQFIVSGALDGLVHVWETANLEAGALATGRGHTSNVNSVAYAPNGLGRIVSGADDKTVRVWILTFTQSLTMDDVNISNSNATTFGGAISADASLLAESCPDDSAAIPHIWSMELRNSSFSTNDASSQGGALALNGEATRVSMCEAKMSSCTFDSNAILSDPDSRGGALSAFDCRMALSSCVFDSNEGREGSAIFYGGVPATPLSTIEATNFSGNVPDDLPTVQADTRIDWTCSPGQYMQKAGAALGDFDGCLECIAGYFGTASNETEPTCEEACWEGHFCEAASVVPQKCRTGTYLPATGAASNESCIECAAGRFGADRGVANCSACPAGRYADVPGLIECVPCARGGYCEDEGADTSMVFTPCEPGRWSDIDGASNSSTCRNCSAGTFQPRIGATNMTDCRPCRKGGFCLEGVPEPTYCATGRFMNETGATACIDCAVGAFCPLGAAAVLPCQGGSFGNSTSLTSQDDCYPCPPGHFCFAGSTEASVCGAGTYAASERSELCRACPEGTYQGKKGATNCTVCDDGYSCPEGSVVQIPASCEAGSYPDATHNHTCVGCPAGSWCAGGASQPRPCSRGSFCPANASETTPCVAGRYGSEEELANESCSGVCLRGYYCELGSMSAKAAPCAEGSYGNRSGLVSQANCSSCLEGHACPEAAIEPLPCGAGTAQPNASHGECEACIAGRFMNGTGATACHECTIGAYCARGAAAALPCLGGSFGNTTGLSSQDDCHPCPPGHFCFAGSVEASACSAGTYAEKERSELCTACQEGTYQGNEGATNCTVCKPGHTCPEGSVTAIPASCKEQTFLNNTLADTLSDPMDACMPCPAGSWCAGGSTQPQPCSRGTYCPANVSVSTDCPAGRFGEELKLTDANCSGICTRGHYCEEGSSTPLPCEAGRYHDSTLEVLLSKEDCIPCEPGFSCPAGAAQPDGCAPGSFAPNASSATCDRCPAGTYQSDEQATACEVCAQTAWCAAGSSAPTPCSNGTYGNGTGLQSKGECLPCEMGYWCSAGVAIPCGTSTYNNRTGAFNLGYCTACSANSLSKASSTSIEACRCDKDYYDAEPAADAVDCQPCPVGSTCEGDGATLTSLPLLPGYYRASRTSSDARVCPTYSRVTGTDRCVSNETGATCKGNLTGVYCTACPADSYLSTGGECSSCGSLTASTAAVCAAIGVIFLLSLVLVLGSRRLSLLTDRLSAWRRAGMLAEASGLAAKAKQLISFYQMATSIQSAFLVTFPDEVRAVLSACELFSLNLFELGLPLECMGLGSFLQRMTSMLLMPLFLVACTPLIATYLLHDEESDCSWRTVMLRALPMALKLLFVVFALVSAVAVQAFDCEHFDNGERWLRADFSLRCGTDDDHGTMEPSAEYQKVRAVAVLALLLYALGVPLLFLGLLVSCRKQLSRLAPSTKLSSSLSFLCAEYRKRYFVWEVLESVKKLFFISVVRLASPGTIVQLLLAVVIALSCLVYQVTAAPFKRATDNFLAVVSGTAYCFMLVGALTLKLDDIYCTLRDQNKLNDQLKHTFSVPTLPVLVLLLCSTLAALAVSVAILLRETLRDLRQPKLRYTGSHTLVAVPLPTGKTHHLFVSHVWTTAQDQARVLRQRLQMVVPGLRVWLDVEDLTDISALEEAVDASWTLLILVTAGYFQSKNCMRELVRCVETGTPRIAVVEREEAHGGLSEFEARQQCVAAGAKFAPWGFDANSPTADALADALLGTRSGSDTMVGMSIAAGKPGMADSGAPIVYERVGVFQQPMLRLIVQRLVGRREIYMPGEVGLARRGAIAPPSSGRQFHVWCSRHNPGALEVINELVSAGGYRGRLLITHEPSRMAEANHLLLYLSLSTWKDDGPRKTELTAEIKKALQAGRTLLLLHETDEERGGVQQFGHFFGADQTPGELLGLKIYAEIAIGMKAPPYRAVSLGLFDQVINAGQKRGLLDSGSMVRRLPGLLRWRSSSGTSSRSLGAAIDRGESPPSMPVVPECRALEVLTDLGDDSPSQGSPAPRRRTLALSSRRRSSAKGGCTVNPSSRSPGRPASPLSRMLSRRSSGSSSRDPSTRRHPVPSSPGRWDQQPPVL